MPTSPAWRSQSSRSGPGSAGGPSLIRDFRGNYYFAVAGYNGGPGNVLGWAKGDWNRDVDLFVEGIGYVETRNYVKAVAGNYELYKAIYYK